MASLPGSVAPGVTLLSKDRTLLLLRWPFAKAYISRPAACWGSWGSSSPTCSSNTSPAGVSHRSLPFLVFLLLPNIPPSLYSSHLFSSVLVCCTGSHRLVLSPILWLTFHWMQLPSQSDQAIQAHFCKLQMDTFLMFRAAYERWYHTLLGTSEMEIGLVSSFSVGTCSHIERCGLNC